MDGLESSPLATAAPGRPGATIGPAHPRKPSKAIPASVASSSTPPKLTANPQITPICTAIRPPGLNGTPLHIDASMRGRTQVG
jgi:hypothetical protein